LKGHKHNILSMSYFPDGQQMISGSYDRTARQWDLKTGKEIEGAWDVDSHSGRINGIDISVDNTLLASGSDDETAQIWNLETGELVAGPFECFDDEGVGVGVVRFSTDSKKLALKSWAGTILEFDASTLKTVGTSFKGHTNVVTGLALSFDGALVASSSEDDTIKLWAFESRQLLA
ncbi:WD40 repeat-like protein, partial [Suillus brevipes Sb2]